MKIYKITMTSKMGVKSSYTKTYENLSEFEKELLIKGGIMQGLYIDYSITETEVPNDSD